jgi:hypothetical protein
MVIDQLRLSLGAWKRPANGVTVDQARVWIDEMRRHQRSYGRQWQDSMIHSSIRLTVPRVGQYGRSSIIFRIAIWTCIFAFGTQ